MKQITMDFDTYVAELEAARIKGTGFSNKLIESLHEATKKFSLQDYTSHREGMNILFEIVNTLTPKGSKEWQSL